MRPLRLATSLIGVSLIAACSALPGEDEGASSEALAVAGRWKLPAQVAATGAAIRLKYDGAPNWSSRACSGKLKTGADRLGDYLAEQFPAISSVGGYACRQNTANRAKMSVHGTGRALDIFIPKASGGADNGKGDAVANWLVTNAAEIGVQLVIWDRTVWQANGKGDKQYGGPHPHDDHLHVELTIPAADMKTAWFRDMLNGDAGPIDLEPEEDSDEPDASLPPPLQSDAGTPDDPEPDPQPEPDPEPDFEPEPDEPEPPPDPTPLPENEPAPPPVDTADPAPSDSPQSGDLDQTSDEPLIEDEPAEGESDGPAKSSKRRRTSPDVASSGCSAAPGTTSSTLGIPLALALAGVLVRRRRRSS